MKKFLLLLLLSLIACGSEGRELIAPVATDAAATTMPESTVDVVPTAAPTDVVATSAAPTAVAPTATVEAPTEAPPPTATPVPATATPVPDPTQPTEVVIELDGAIVAPGFSVLNYADLPRPTGLSFDAEGRMWVTNHAGEVWVFEDTDNDGRADSRQQYTFGFVVPVGVAVHPETSDVYISQEGKITIARDTDGDLVADAFESFVSGLPFGLHKNNNIEFGPDGWLYVGIGSTCNACAEVDERAATIMRFNPADGAGEILATGLRNPFDLAFRPTTGELFATENGRDDLGNDTPPEELNHIITGEDYGWPDCWGRFEGTCGDSRIAVGFFEARSSVNGLTFYSGDRFPSEYYDNAFATVFGSWVNQDVEHGIHRIQLEEQGSSYRANIEWFLRTDLWLLPIVEGPDGALYFASYDVSDPTKGSIYRVSYGLP